MKKKKILIVDDETDFLNIIKIRLEENKYEVITAVDGAEALRKVEKESPDAVLLDILLPKVDGLRTLKKIREKDKDLPVYIITAFSNEERFKLARKIGASGFIVKTSDLQKEIKNITNVLRMTDKYRSR